MIETVELPEYELICHHCSGQLTAENVGRAAREHCAADWCKLVLWDFSEADVSGIDSGSVRGLAAGSADMAGARQGGRTALYARTEAQYGLCRMYEIYLDLQGQSVPTRTFRSRRAAELWLNGELPAGVGLQDSQD
jgi:hypothetical protein